MSETGIKTAIAQPRLTGEQIATHSSRHLIIKGLEGEDYRKDPYGVVLKLLQVNKIVVTPTLLLCSGHRFGIAYARYNEKTQVSTVLNRLKTPKGIQVDNITDIVAFHHALLDSIGAELSHNDIASIGTIHFPALVVYKAFKDNTHLV